MKLFKLPLFILMFALATNALAQIYPPFPNPATSSVYYGIYPVNVEVPYGKTSTSPFTYQLQYYVVNNTTNTYTLSNFVLTPVSPPVTNPVTITGYTTDCANVLKSSKLGGTCNIFVNISAVNNSDSPINYNFKFDYTAGRTKATQAAPSFPISFATGAVIPSASRTFTFVNNCTDTDVYFGVDSGAAPAITPNPSIQPADPQSCLIDADCYPGSTCVQVQALPTVLKHCFWENPAPTNAIYKLNKTSGPAPHSNTVDFPVYDNGLNISWNGGIAGRVACDESGSTACKVADCGVDPDTGFTDGACPVPGGFAAPSTLAEFSLLTQNPIITATSGAPAHDTYDITLINGVTIPTSMKPTSAAWGGNSSPYTCAEPGAQTLPVGNTTLGACTWFSILPPATAGNGAVAADFVWVDTDNPGSSCPCVGPEVCGHSVTGATVSALTCGTPLGYLTADAVCAIDKTFGAPFNCATTVYENGTNYTLAEIYGCSSGDFKNSCYSAGATAACCGCEDWFSTATVPPAPLTQACSTTANNSNWQAVQITTDFLPWFKQVCPTAYIYPYDDASSTFVCQDTDANNNNVVDYTITFCPA